MCIAIIEYFTTLGWAIVELLKPMIVITGACLLIVALIWLTLMLITGIKGLAREL